MAHSWPFAKPIFFHINYLVPNSCRFSANLLSFYKGIADYLRYLNEERPHQGLDNRTPDDVFYKRKPLTKAA